jgi:hypothetical protein
MPELDWNNLKTSTLNIFPKTSEEECKGIRASIKKHGGIWDHAKIILISYPGLSEPEIGTGRTRYQCGKEVGHIFTSKYFYLRTFESREKAEEFVIDEGKRRNMDDNARRELVKTLIDRHPEWGLKRLADAANCSHMTVSRYRKDMKAADEKAKKDAKSAAEKKEEAYNDLVKAWDAAAKEDDAQERFVSEYKIDLADLLRSLG